MIPQARAGADERTSIALASQIHVHGAMGKVPSRCELRAAISVRGRLGWERKLERREARPHDSFERATCAATTAPPRPPGRVPKLRLLDNGQASGGKHFGCSVNVSVGNNDHGNAIPLVHTRAIQWCRDGAGPAQRSAWWSGSGSRSSRLVRRCGMPWDCPPYGLTLPLPSLLSPPESTPAACSSSGRAGGGRPWMATARGRRGHVLSMSMLVVRAGALLEGMATADATAGDRQIAPAHSAAASPRGRGRGRQRACLSECSWARASRSSLLAGAVPTRAPFSLAAPSPLGSTPPRPSPPLFPPRPPSTPSGSLLRFCACAPPHPSHNLTARPTVFLLTNWRPAFCIFMHQRSHGASLPSSLPSPLARPRWLPALR